MPNRRSGLSGQSIKLNCLSDKAMDGSASSLVDGMAKCSVGMAI